MITRAVNPETRAVNPGIEGMETVIASVTLARAESLADGALVDVSPMAREAGITYPVVLTAALHADVAAVPDHQSWQSYDGRLWDVLTLFRAAVKGLIPSAGDDQCRTYTLIMHVGSRTFYRVSAVCGPGDDLEPVITLMQPGEVEPEAFGSGGSGTEEE